MYVFTTEIALCIVVALPASNVRVNLSKAEIFKLADQIIANSKQVHDAVASVPLDKVFVNSFVSCYSCSCYL